MTRATTVDEIAPDTFRISTMVENGLPGGFGYNQFLVRDDEPFLFHTGPRDLYPVVSAAVEQLVGLDRLRWISFGHVEADECGSMNQLLAAAPDAQVVHGFTACLVSLTDLADRPPHAVGDDEVLDLGHHRLRYLSTPHVPHGWESGLWFDETTRTLFSGDLFTQVGDGPAVLETSPARSP
jgi:flavorubredoxin